MQLMTFNSLLMFDIVFVFFLFLVGVTCLVYYMPPVSLRSSASASSASSSSSSSSISNSDGHNRISASVATKTCRHHGHHGYQALHHHPHHPRNHCTSAASRMATHREHGFAAAAVVSSSDCELQEIVDRSTSDSVGSRDDHHRCRSARSGSATIEFFTATAATAAKFVDEGRLLVERPLACTQVKEATAIVATTSEAGGATRTVPQCCYVKEKWQRSSLSSSRKYHQAPVHEV